MKAVDLNIDNNIVKAYEFEDIAFCNTSLFTEAARHYEKHGCYTFAPAGSYEHKLFWDIEEDRILKGITAPGKLLPDGTIQEVHITGLHYAYLNYGRIKLTSDKNEVSYGKSDENILKNRSATKKEGFPAFWDGDYHFFKAKELCRQLGKHLVVSKGRRKGYSYKNGMVAAYTPTFIPKSVTILGAYDKKYLTTKGGITSMAKTYLDWFQTETDFNRGWLKEVLEDLQLGYYKSGSRVAHGYKSALLSLSFMDNPDAAIGKDAEEIIFEEAGNFPNLLDALDVTMSTMEDGDYVTGSITVFGTGGSREGNYAAFEKLFYEPLAYGFLPFHNVWDDEAKNTVCGFFHGQQQNLVPYVDNDGNSDIKTSLEVIKKRREIKKKETSSVKTFNRYCAQRCIKPSEAFSGTEVSIYDSPDLREHIAVIERNPLYTNMRREGILVRDNSKTKFFSSLEIDLKDKHPFLDGKINVDKDLTGTYAEWFRPYKDSHGNVPDNLYRIWNDPYAYRKEKGDITIIDSLGSSYVYEVPNNITSTGGDCLVACYVGRPPDPDDYNETLLAMSLRWNAIVQFENDRGEVKGYFKRNGFFDRLADSPDFDWKRELKGKSTFIDKGVRLAEGSDRKGNGAILLKKWLYQKRGYNTETGKPIYTFNTIYDLGLLKELTKWNLKGNFDRVSALIVGMFDKNEILYNNIKVEQTLAENSFFARMNNNEFF